jgi:hypothetical protein
MSNIRNRHWLVDVGFLMAGGFFSAAVTSKSIGYGLASAVIAILTIYIDRRNIESEEREINNCQTQDDNCF